MLISVLGLVLGYVLGFVHAWWAGKGRPALVKTQEAKITPMLAPADWQQIPEHIYSFEKLSFLTEYWERGQEFVGYLRHRTGVVFPVLTVGVSGVRVLVYSQLRNSKISVDLKTGGRPRNFSDSLNPYYPKELLWTEFVWHFPQYRNELYTLSFLEQAKGTLEREQMQEEIRAQLELDAALKQGL